MRKFFTIFLLSSLIYSVQTAEFSREERLAFIGDSITASNGYSVQLETYLKACAGKRNIKVRSFAFPGDTALGFNKRLDEVIDWKPTIATIQFGMNDGFYGRYTDWMGDNYRKGLTVAINALRKAGCIVYLATPTVMDPVYGKPSSIYAGKCDAETYNLTLKKLAGFTEEISKAQNIREVELFELMSKVMMQCKQKYGEKYAFAGLDGVHPGANGQMVITHAFLEALEMDGKIAEIHADMKGEASVSEGHEVLSWKDGELELESRRYPFCHSPETEEVLSFIPFQEKFNRFELKFANLPDGKYEISWGPYVKNFSADELVRGINLADEFRINPFTTVFRVLHKQIECKQQYEVFLVFELLPQLRNIEKSATPEAVNVLKKQLANHQVTTERKIAGSLFPVKHKIKIKKVN
ncbi:MAG: SGNH/GDSL hydrolase family protein [Desulfobacterales bacterium]|jgi:lysophospholipase L1-like esterase|nr:SGNH/GDSL hydrolase family protein [Desulfobacterales bacterium]